VFQAAFAEIIHRDNNIYVIINYPDPMQAADIKAVKRIWSEYQKRKKSGEK
jgi:hypothetical protein